MSPGRVRRLTDEDLRADLESGLRIAEIADKYGISVAAVYKRKDKLKLTTLSAAVAPVESQRYVAHQLDAQELILSSLDRVQKLSDAIDLWMCDPDHPGTYHIGPRSTEIDVIYETGEGVSAKASLQTLLHQIEENGISVRNVEANIADPRTLMLSTAQELRSTVGQCLKLAQMLSDARAMQVFREALLQEISKVSPEVAEKIARAVRSIHVLADSAG